MVQWQQDGPKKYLWVERKEYFLKGAECFCPFSKPHLEKHRGQTSRSCHPLLLCRLERMSHPGVLSGHIITAPKKSSGHPRDSSLLKFDWPKYFQIFSRTQSCSSQALMSVISVICFSIQLQLKTAKFFLSHYRTK